MTRRRRLVVFAAIASLPCLTAGLWAASYLRRDLVVWDGGAGGSIRTIRQAYSSWGRVAVMSYSSPADADAGGAPIAPAGLAHRGGRRSTTETIAEDVRRQLQQAGLLQSNWIGMEYSQHVGTMASGEHVWTAAVLPWWLITAVSATLPATYIVRRARQRSGSPHRAEPAVATSA